MEVKRNNKFGLLPLENSMYRIFAIKTFELFIDGKKKVISKGTYGGTVSDENNLCVDDNSWISFDSSVKDDSYVCGNSYVCNSSCVAKSATVKENSLISGTVVGGFADVSNSKIIDSEIYLTKDATAKTSLRKPTIKNSVIENSQLLGNIVVSGSEIISKIQEGIILYGAVGIYSSEIKTKKEEKMEIRAKKYSSEQQIKILNAHIYENNDFFIYPFNISDDSMFVAYSCKKQNNGTRWRVVVYKNKKHSFFILKFSKLFGFVDIFYDEIDKKYHKLLRSVFPFNILFKNTLNALINVSSENLRIRTTQDKRFQAMFVFALIKVFICGWEKLDERLVFDIVNRKFVGYGDLIILSEKLLHYFCNKNGLDYIDLENKIKKNKKTIILHE